jgi:hypothetical protein
MIIINFKTFFLEKNIETILIDVFLIKCTRCTLKSVRTVRFDVRVDVRFCTLFVRNEYGNTETVTKRYKTFF